MSDFPFETIVEAVGKHADKGEDCYQKFSCSKCGSRQTMDEPNVLYTHGKCEECGHITDITVTGCNYMLHINLNRKKIA